MSWFFFFRAQVYLMMRFISKTKVWDKWGTWFWSWLEINDFGSEQIQEAFFQIDKNSGKFSKWISILENDYIDFPSKPRE